MTPEYIDNMLNVVYLDNELWRYLSCVGALLLSFTLGKIIERSFRQSSNASQVKKHEVLRITFRSLAASITFIVLTIGLKIGSTFLFLTEELQRGFDIAIGSLFSVSIAILIIRLVDVPCSLLLEASSKKHSSMGQMMIPAIRRTLQVIVGVLATVQIVQIISDQPVSSILAGLGIGGLAIGLAAKDTLANIFGSLVVFTDRPFELEDRIIISGVEGFVEEVGMRSTKLRTLKGHLVTIPNSDLATKTIENVSKRPFIKKIFNVGVTYNTAPEKLQEAITILKDIFENRPEMDPGRAPWVHFTDFNDSSLNIQVVFWFIPPEYLDFLAFCNETNAEILKRFNAAGIEFAFPTQSLYVEGFPKEHLPVQVLQKTS